MALEGAANALDFMPGRLPCELFVGLIFNALF